MKKILEIPQKERLKIRFYLRAQLRKVKKEHKNLFRQTRNHTECVTDFE